VKSLLSALRIKEIIGKAGFFMVGVLFAEPPINVRNLTITIHFFVICMVNGIAIYLFNAALGFHQDKTNSRLDDLKQFEKTKLLVLGVVAGAIGFVWLYLFSPVLVLPALIVYALWIIYSFPGGLKRVPLLGLLTAFAGQLVHFHLGYFVFDELSIESVLIAGYFSLLFTAGHALHEVIDYEADKEAGLKTSAVFFGRSFLNKVSTALFVLAALYLLGVYLLGAISWTILVPYELAFVVQMFLISRLPDSENETLFAYRRTYMIMYAAATLLVAILINIDL
jgi:4-hydroxybenzoate polyprenyltransferase